MRCPVCRADNDDATCRRCKADLSLLFDVESARTDALQRAAYFAAKGDGLRTLQHAEAAHHLRRDAESWRWLAVGGLLIHDYPLAVACWKHASAES